LVVVAPQTAVEEEEPLLELGKRNALEVGE
jgi:hypothetical protein